MKIKFRFIKISIRGKSKWNALQEDGKRDGKCAGNGKERDWKKKSVKENCEELEADNSSYIFFRIIIYIKKNGFWIYAQRF